MMNSKFLDLIPTGGATAQPADREQLVRALDALSSGMAAVLGNCDSSAWHAILAEFGTRVLAVLREKEAKVNKPNGHRSGDAECSNKVAADRQNESGPAPVATPVTANLAREALSPEILEWARLQFTEEEFIAGIREIQATGGLKLPDFIHELEQAATSDE